MGFEEVAHTADWSVRVWGRDLQDLLSEAARAMNTLADVEVIPGKIQTRTFDFTGTDSEAILIAFLSELLYYQEQENLAFTEFLISIEDHQVHVQMQGAPIISIHKAIKAVTWHNLGITQTPRGLETEIVFDV